MQNPKCMGNYKVLTNRVKIRSDIRRAVKHFTFGLIPLTNRDHGIFQFRKKKQALKLKLAYSYLLKQLHPLINSIKAERYCTLCLAWDPSVHTPKYSQTVLLSYAYCSHTAFLLHVTEQTGLLEKN